MEHWNETAFLFVNAPEHPAPWLAGLAMVLASVIIYVVPALLVTLWLWGATDNRPGLLLAVIACGAALVVNQLIAALWYHRRPFAVPIGRTLIDHATDSSFPSDHVTVLLTIGLGLLAFTRARWAGIGVVSLALPVAWARLYLGAHFPLDMLGALPVAAAATWMAALLRGWVTRAIMPGVVEPLYRRVFGAAIGRGWVRG